MIIRPYDSSDSEAVWSMLEPVLRAAETYALPYDWSCEEALSFWCAPEHSVFVAVDGQEVVGSYYLQPNQRGGGSHVANCGFVTAARATGRGIASAMCAHALAYAADQGFRAMQFNFVVATNIRAVALWQRFGFDIIGTLPKAFRHPTMGFVDALVMFRQL